MEDKISIFKEFMEEVHALLKDREIKLGSIDDQLPIAIMARIMCGCDSMLILLNARLHTFVPIILRSIEEASVDLYNLVNDKKYILIMKYSFSKQEESLLEHFEGKKEYASFFAAGSTARKRLDKAREFLKVHGKLQKKTKLLKRFDKAGLLEEYKTTYNDLCRCTHNNIDMIISSHIKNGGKDVVVHDQSNAAQSTKHIDLALGICFTSASIISKKYGFTDFDLSKAEALLEQFRDKYIRAAQEPRLG